MNLGLGAGLGWAGWGWAGLGWAGWAGLGWAGPRPRPPSPSPAVPSPSPTQRPSPAHPPPAQSPLGVAGLGWGLGSAGWAGAALKLKLVYSKMATVCPERKYELSNGQQQQAISIYFFLEGLGFRV